MKTEDELIKLTMRVVQTAIDSFDKKVCSHLESDDYMMAFLHNAGNIFFLAAFDMAKKFYTDEGYEKYLLEVQTFFEEEFRKRASVTQEEIHVQTSEIVQ